MTATITPAEQDELTRFHMWDEEIIADLDKHFDEEPECEADDCDASATAILIQTCCGSRAFICDTHLDHDLKLCARWLLTKGVHCRSCGREYMHPETVEDVLKVVNL